MRAWWKLPKSLMPVLVMFGLVACADIGSPPRDLLAKDDHAALAAWYAKEAADLRWKVEEMRLMRNMYEAPSYQPAPKESKAELIAHCQRFIELYSKAAEEAESMAQAYRGITEHKHERDR